ncbi:Cupin domain-containing protein [Dyadobacter jejuensis]|uniref:Cupin domain-containing protein n=1 Tax=Dyadobacter jejuensis TaxID=1082580 RepID=A0A316ALM4_9BACT|nr:cupin domain-containing protein [Dyadobacter jejuensis]PWJ58461.1 Cupin domain-containing protein [Dyadobacter jejuensis]
MNYKSDKFINDQELDWEVVGEGVRRKIMAYDNQIMLVKVEFQVGSIGPIHDHFHSQVTYVESGSFEVTIDSEKKVLQKGDAFYIPPHAPHGAVCTSVGVLIDVFSPIREDFMPVVEEAEKSNSLTN